jgi:penicillin-binding protein 1C
VVHTRVSFGERLEAERDEWFLPGTQQASFAIAPDRATDGASHITAPADGTIVALDPDIPPQRQRVRFTANAQKVRWRLDGKEAARGARWDWLPWPGRHRIELVADNGQVLDELHIEVRGAGVRAAGVSKFGGVRKNAQSQAAAAR